jgi:hypothetical protein
MWSSIDVDKEPNPTGMDDVEVPAVIMVTMTMTCHCYLFSPIRSEYLGVVALQTRLLERLVGKRRLLSTTIVSERGREDSECGSGRCVFRDTTPFPPDDGAPALPSTLFCFLKPVIH